MVLHKVPFCQYAKYHPLYIKFIGPAAWVTQCEQDACQMTHNMMNYIIVNAMKVQQCIHNGTPFTILIDINVIQLVSACTI